MFIIIIIIIIIPSTIDKLNFPLVPQTSTFPHLTQLVRNRRIWRLWLSFLVIRTRRSRGYNKPPINRFKYIQTHFYLEQICVRK